MSTARRHPSDDPHPFRGEARLDVEDVCDDCGYARGPHPNEGPLLTDLERDALELSGRLADMIRKIIYAGQIDGHSSVADCDWNEAASDIHRIQHRIGAQAAARAYPGEYRLLGRSIQR